MKKKAVVSLALSALLALSMATTVFAAGSSTTTNTQTTTQTTEQSVHDANEAAALAAQAAAAEAAAAGGAAAQQQAVVLTSGVVPAGVTVNGVASAAVVAPLAPATVQSAAVAAATLVSPSATVLKAFDLSIPGYTGGTAQITLAVSGVVAGQNVAVLHQQHNGVWERVPSTTGNGTVTATFTSLSPVAIVAGGISDKTGQSVAMLILAVACGAGMAFFGVRMKRAK